MDNYNEYYSTKWTNIHSLLYARHDMENSIYLQTKNAKAKCRKNNVGTKTSDIRAGSNNTSFTTTRYMHDKELT